MNSIVQTKLNEQTVLSTLIQNTRTPAGRRNKNLWEIAEALEWAEKKWGGLKNVSERIDVSVGMLRQFFSVRNISSPPLKKLVRERKIDSVTIVHKIRNFEEAKQNQIANAVLSGRLSSSDVRVLIPFILKHPELSIDEAITYVESSKNKKVYVIKYDIPAHTNLNLIRKQIEKTVNKSEIIQVNNKHGIGRIELTRRGLKILREAAKAKKLSLRQFVEKMILNFTDGA